MVPRGTSFAPVIGGGITGMAWKNAYGLSASSRNSRSHSPTSTAPPLLTRRLDHHRLRPALALVTLQQRARRAFARRGDVGALADGKSLALADHFGGSLTVGRAIRRDLANLTAFDHPGFGEILESVGGFLLGGRGFLRGLFGLFAQLAPPRVVLRRRWPSAWHWSRHCSPSAWRWSLRRSPATSRWPRRRLALKSRFDLSHQRPNASKKPSGLRGAAGWTCCWRLDLLWGLDLLWRPDLLRWRNVCRSGLRLRNLRETGMRQQPRGCAQRQYPAKCGSAIG